jgi:hypothetical protein
MTVLMIGSFWVPVLAVNVSIGKAGTPYQGLTGRKNSRRMW